jgi:hypothetical protein
MTPSVCWGLFDWLCDRHFHRWCCQASHRRNPVRVRELMLVMPAYSYYFLYRRPSDGLESDDGLPVTPLCIPILVWACILNVFFAVGFAL